MKFMKKYWYIVLGPLALIVLFGHTLWVYDRRDGILLKPSAWQVYGSFFFWGIIMSIPTTLVYILVAPIEHPLAESLPLVCAYLAAIYPTYRHALFREKYHISLRT